MIAWILVLLACSSTPTTTAVQSRGPSATTVDPILGGLRARPLELTHHAKCRMACRHVSKAEIEEILLVGTVDPARTRMDGECPSYAVEGRTSDGQDVRIVYAACPSTTRVVTAIDLGQDWPCDCD